ncbi:LexA family transcriptional regulator [Flavobacterium crassostreae]|uniref:HTH cro/C1-type domain-containing protein n=1 Tax=Flavobacterium crassostreae TaxID=1763534 RepID=A0A1B9E7T3_9FLAO|nr:helix-turn-helix domain-containing protein [Flavobacterium crassostreae]OCB78005.1 hypothetical protein LPBF_03385 [Flavobacterium crassostreae]
MKGIEIRNKRKELGLTQKDLAIKLGVSHNTISNWEKGEVIPLSKENLLNNFVNNNIVNFATNEDQKKITLQEQLEHIEKGVPYYDVDFTAGFLPIDHSNKSLPDSYISHPFFKGCDYVVRASGQSMAKLICHGDAIGLVKINNWQDFFPFGEIYAIVTTDNFRMIKIITKGETDDCYTLISKPTDSKKEEFPPQQLKKSTILSLFKVQASSHLF